MIVYVFTDKHFVNMNRFLIISQHMFPSKNDLTKRATFILLLSSFVSFSDSIDANTTTSECKEVFWKVKLSSGGDVTLTCKTDAKHLCSECRKVWYGGSNFSLLSLDGFRLADSFKYLPILGSNGFEIIIRNFSSEDLNQHYICSIGEHSCKRNLTINMFDKHLLDRDVPEDDTNSNISKEDIVVMAGLLSGVGVFAIFIMMYSIKHKCTCNVSKKRSTSTESHVSTGSVPSYDSQHIPNNKDEHLFIPPITSNEDNHKPSENDELI